MTACLLRATEKDQKRLEPEVHRAQTIRYRNLLMKRPPIVFPCEGPKCLILLGQLRPTVRRRSRCNSQIPLWGNPFPCRKCAGREVELFPKSEVLCQWRPRLLIGGCNENAAFRLKRTSFARLAVPFGN